MSIKWLYNLRILICVIFCCIILSVLGYAIPVTSEMMEHMNYSSKYLLTEGDYHSINIVYETKLDNFTDSLILCTAAYGGKETLLQKVFGNYRYYTERDTLTEQAYSVYVDEAEDKSIISYVRYWHGYVPFIKIALHFFEYLQIRKLNLVLQILLFIIIILLLIKRKLTNYIVPYIVYWLMLNPVALGLSLQFSPVYYVTSGATIGLLLRPQYRKPMNLVLYFAVIGIVTNWLDLLTYPIVTLGIPLAVYMLLHTEKKFKDRLTQCLIASIAWGMGWGGMWSLKWILSSLVLHQNVFKEAMQQAQFRASTSFNGVTWKRSDILLVNLRQLNKPFIIITFMLSLLYSGISWWKRRTYIIKGNFETVILLIIISLMPIAWYMILSNHSFIHNFFTYRSLGVTVFCWSCLLIPDSVNFSFPIKRKK
ncbi:hypothetical protein [Hungatella hathewayi]|nr:hypothetical protein [Hungatella hathewayi]